MMKYSRPGRKGKCLFYIVDQENGKYSLCLAFSFLEEEYKEFGQDVFDRYALEIGELIMDDMGLFLHGSVIWSKVFFVH